MKFIVEKIADGVVTLGVPGTNYENSFKVGGTAALPAAGEPVQGTIHAPAWKLDVVELGGNYVEPLAGRPRRMQGTVLAVNPADNELTVKVGYLVTVKLPEKYKAADYAVGTHVGWDNVDIPTFMAGA